AGSAEPAKIRDALEQTKDLPTVTGMTTMNETHDAEKELGIVEIREGKKVFLGTIKPEV
ncbi:branched-chain amino acid ABC transporter substrate-binding protein, partial [Fretibacterium sp. OH1220_COT-178]